MKRSHSPSSSPSSSDLSFQTATTSSSPSKKSKFSIDQLLEEREIKDLEVKSNSIDSGIDVPESKEEELISLAEKSPQKLKRPPLISNSLPILRTGQGNGFRLEKLKCKLEAADLWKAFYKLETEMIITKSGRRMFPTVKIAFLNVEFDALYYVFLDVVRVDSKRYRYIYGKSSWQAAGKAEPEHKNRLHLHPDSPFTGEQLLKQTINFEKAKLTNNEVDRAGQLVLTSMHKYQPRIHVVVRDKGNPLDHHKVNLENEEYRTFEFPETQFMAVTAYQNQLITKLKIEKNPFAKGFRDPSGRSPDEYEPQPPIFPPMGGSLLQPNIMQQQLFMETMLRLFHQQNYPLTPQLRLGQPNFNQLKLLTGANVPNLELSPSQLLTPSKPPKSPLSCT